MDERLRFVARLLDGESMSDVCRAFGISRKTGYKIFERYKEHGLEALSDRSRRPVRYANQLPPQIDSRDFLMARRRAETQVLMPAGQRIAFTGGMDCNDHQRVWAALFKRNDVLLETLPIGVVVFPGSGISDNLADKARKLGIPLFDFRKAGGG